MYCFAEVGEKPDCRETVSDILTKAVLGCEMHPTAMVLHKCNRFAHTTQAAALDVKHDKRHPLMSRSGLNEFWTNSPNRIFLNSIVQSYAKIKCWKMIGD